MCSRNVSLTIDALRIIQGGLLVQRDEKQRFRFQVLFVQQ